MAVRATRRLATSTGSRPATMLWVVGDEPAVFVEFQGAENYAKA